MKIEKGIEKFLDLEFLKKETRGFGIIEINTEDPSCSYLHPDWIEEESWKCGSIAKLRRKDMPGDYYKLHFIPKLDKEKAAKWLSKRLGVKIFPKEIYIFALFHELGHTRKITGDLSPEGLKMSFLKDPSQQSELRLEAEKRADSFAKKKLEKYRIKRRIRISDDE